MIKEYNEITTKIVIKYLEKLCMDIYEEELDDYDIMEYQGIVEGPVNFGGMYLNIDDILIAYHYNISGKISLDYYYLSLESYEEKGTGPGIKLYNYYRKATLSPEILQKEEEDRLRASEERVKIAKEIFENAIKIKT